MISTHSKYGEYRIVRSADGAPVLLGEGSFGKTFQAVRIDEIAGSEIQTRAALKVLNPQLLWDEGKRRQLIREVEALTQLDHPNLIRYIGCGEQQGEIFYAMGLCRGGSLTSLVARCGPLPERAAALVGLQVAGGLRELARRNLIHRDIKPSNVMLAEEIDPTTGEGDLARCFEAHESIIRLVDFGLVNAQEDEGQSRQGFAGSPMYASPEQLREQPLDARSDIYSLGMTLWHLLEGKPPFVDATGTTVASLGEAICRHLAKEDFDAALPASLSPEFKRLLARMIAKKREDRFADAAELVSALRAYLARTMAALPMPSTAPDLRFVRLAKPLDAIFTAGKTLSSKGPRRSYAAVDQSTGRKIRLTSLAPPSGPDVERHLRQLALISRMPSCPPTIFRVEALLETESEIACVEPVFSETTLADILKARATARRSTTFVEASAILRAIADGLDHLLENGQSSVLLRADEIWVKHPSEAAGGPLPSRASDFASFKGLEGGFSIMFILPALAPENEAAFETNTGSLALSAEDRHPVAAFARLVYRIVNGAEAPAVARLSPDGYPPTIALSAASNELLRDCICRRKVSRNATQMLRSLCANEGLLYDASRGSTASTMDAPARAENSNRESGALDGAAFRNPSGAASRPRSGLARDKACEALPHSGCDRYGRRRFGACRVRCGMDRPLEEIAARSVSPGGGSRLAKRGINARFASSRSCCC